MSVKVLEFCYQYGSHQHFRILGKLYGCVILSTPTYVPEPSTKEPLYWSALLDLRHKFKARAEAAKTAKNNEECIINRLRGSTQRCDKIRKAHKQPSSSIYPSPITTEARVLSIPYAIPRWNSIWPRTEITRSRAYRNCFRASIENHLLRSLQESLQECLARKETTVAGCRGYVGSTS